MATRRSEMDDTNVEQEKLLGPPLLVQSSLEKKIAETDLTARRVCTPKQQIFCFLLFVAVVVCGYVALIAIYPGSGFRWWGDSVAPGGAVQDVPTNPFARVPSEPTYGAGAATGITGPEKDPINPMPETPDTKPAEGGAPQPSQDDSAQVQSPGAGAPGPDAEPEERLIPTKWTGRRLLGLPAIRLWA